MVLSGSLHEFILADVFQLLSQQKATGKLVVTSDKRCGHVILKEGIIAGAREDSDSLEARLTNCLETIKRVPSRDVSRLVSGSGNRTGPLCSAALQKKMISEAELRDLACAAIEDIACSLFAWKQGTYRFESQDNVDGCVVRGVALGTDTIIMEAMRRIDELKRDSMNIPPTTVFVRTSPPTPLSPTGTISEILREPDAYLLSLVNGMQPVPVLASQTFLGYYRVIETLSRLLERQDISPLSPRVSRSIHAALNQGRKNQFRAVTTLAASTGLCFLVMLLFLALRITLEHRYPSSEWMHIHRQTPMEVTGTVAGNARLLFRTRFGRLPYSQQELIESRYLTSKEIRSITEP